MRWLFFASFVVLSSFCLGQVPDYVPVDRSEAWYSMAGNSEDNLGNGNHLIADGEEHGSSGYNEFGILYSLSCFSTDEGFYDTDFLIKFTH